MADDNNDDDQKQPQIVINAGQPSPDQLAAAARIGKPPGPPAPKYDYSAGNLEDKENTLKDDIGNSISKVLQPPQSPYQQMQAQANPQQQQPPAPTNVSLGAQPQQQGGVQQAGYQPPAGNPAYDEYIKAAQAQVDAIRSQGQTAKASAALLGQQGLEENQQYTESNQKIQDLTTDFQNQYKQHNDELHNALKDLNDGHINPNQFYENRSVPQKISTAIGMIIAGAGSGLLHQENPVIKWVNAQVDRDIDAQKNNINSAYTHYHQQMGDSRQAENMSRALLQQNLANQIRSTATKYAGPLAQQNANAIASQFEGASQKLVGEIAMQKAQQRQQMNAQQMASSDQLSPAQKLHMMVNAGMIPKEEQKAISTEIGQAENARNSAGYMLAAFDKAAQENTFLRTGAGMLRTPASISEMNAIALPIIHDAEGRVNEFEQKTLQDLQPKPGDTEEKIAAKRQGLQHFLMQKQAMPNASQYGITVPRQQRNTFKPYGQ